MDVLQHGGGEGLCGLLRQRLPKSRSLRKLGETEYKKEVLEYSMGYSDKGYLDMCRYCNGAEAKDKPIPVAEQMERV